MENKTKLVLLDIQTQRIIKELEVENNSINIMIFEEISHNLLDHVLVEIYHKYIEIYSNYGKFLELLLEKLKIIFYYLGIYPFIHLTLGNYLRLTERISFGENI